MKPHKETWVVHPMDFRAVCELNAEDPSESLVVADVRADEPREVATLIAAAPEMARALLSEFGSFGGGNDAEWHTNECWGAQQGPACQPCARRCTTTRALLAKAGVLP